MIDPINFLIGSLWGGTTLLTWSIVFWRKLQAWRRRHDWRSFRELVGVSPLFVMAVLVAVALFFVVVRDVFDVGSNVRGVLFGLVIGFFTGAGIIAALEPPDEVKA